MINQLNDSLPVTDNNGLMENRFKDWTKNVTRLQVVSGVGSPEGIVVATQESFYMDINGTTGNILYIKRNGDIAGDRKQGWVLV